MTKLREMTKRLVGNLADIFVPSLRWELETDRHSGHFVKLKRWILFARSARARARGDMHDLQKKPVFTLARSHF